MKKLGVKGRLITGSLALVLMFGMLAGGFFTHTRVRAAHAIPPKSHAMHLQPVYRPGGKPNGQNQFQCQAPDASPRCYSPSQMRTIYDIQRVLNAGITGKGTTIVIIDAYQSPTLRQDLDFFDTTFKLPAAHLKIVAPDGLPPFNANDTNQVGWSAEISLDVEWAHAIAPAATIDLVLAKDNQDANLLRATKYAVDNRLGQVISQSFGEAESCIDPDIMNAEHQIFLRATRAGITVFASAGDQGAAQPTCDDSSFSLGVSTPASDPYVTAVGATHVDTGPDASYKSESVWNDSYGAGGGGFSSVYEHPSFQDGFVDSQARGLPDVAYDGDVNGGVLVSWGVPQGVGTTFIFGGTSAGAPQWAGMLALVDSTFGPQGDINPLLYQRFANQEYAQVFHDVTVGNNTYTSTDANGNTVTVAGYDAGPGWDPPTGLGSFDLGNSILGSGKGVPKFTWAHHPNITGE